MLNISVDRCEEKDQKTEIAHKIKGFFLKAKKCYTRKMNKEDKTSPTRSPDTTVKTPPKQSQSKLGYTKSKRKGNALYVHIFLHKSILGSPDTITCGQCLESFPLDNFLAFIQHKGAHILRIQVESLI